MTRVKKSTTVTEKHAQNSEIKVIRAALIEAEQSGFTNKTADQIRQQAKGRLRATLASRS